MQLSAGVPKTAKHLQELMEQAGVCSVPKFLVEHLPRGFSTQFETVDKERLSWQALARCLVTEHTPGVLAGWGEIRKIIELDIPI